jgi:hypothetical protein
LIPPVFALPFGNIAAYVPIERNKTGIHRLERLVLDKADFFLYSSAIKFRWSWLKVMA